MADKIIIKIPRGVAVYPALSRPDTRFDDLGSYKADVAIPRDRAEGVLKKLNALYRDHMGKVHPKHPDSSNKNAIWYVETDSEGEETGNVVIKLRVKNKIIKKTGEVWDRRPAQFDAKGKPIGKPKNAWGGSEFIVSAEVYCWENNGTKGLSLQPLAVQIIKLVEGGSAAKAVSDFGFGEEDGGYEDDGPGFGDESDDDDDYGGDATADAVDDY